MADIQSNVEIKVTADTKQALGALGALANGATNLRQNLEGMTNGLGKQLDTAAIALAKFNLALGGINKALQIGRDVWNMTVEMTRLNDVARSLSADAMPKLTKATHGLVTQMDLVRAAGRGMTGQLALDADQMATVAEAALVLSQKGFGPFSTLVDQLSQKIKKGGEGLDEYGVAFQKTGVRALDTRKALESLNAMIEANSAVLDGQSAKLKKASAAMGDLVGWFKQAAANDVSGAVDIASQFGKDVDYWIVRPFKALDGWLASNEKRATDLALSLAGLYRLQPPKWLPTDFLTGTEKNSPRIQKAAAAGKESPLLTNALGMSWVSEGALGSAIYDVKPDTFTGGGKNKGFGGGAAPVFVLKHATVVMEDSELRRLSSTARLLGALPAGLPVPDVSRRSTGLEGRITSAADARGLWARGSTSMGAASGLGFDVVQEMSATNRGRLGQSLSDISDPLTKAGASFSIMSSAMTASVDAFITGEQSMGKAALGAAANAIRGLAAQATVRAAWNLALAWENPAAAPKFLVAAAKMTGVAALAASVAAGLGAAYSGGGGGSSGGGSGGGGSAGAGGGYFGSRREEGAGSITVVIEGDVYDSDALAEKVTYAIEKARRSGRVRGDSPTVIRS